MRRFLVEEIAGIAVVGKESEAYGALLATPDLEVVCAYAVGSKEVCRLSAHDVCSRITDKGAGHTGSSDAYDAVETASAVHCRLWLPASEEDVENRLAHSDYFPLLLHYFLLALQS